MREWEVAMVGDEGVESTATYKGQVITFNTLGYVFASYTFIGLDWAGCNLSLYTYISISLWYYLTISLTLHVPFTLWLSRLCLRSSCTRQALPVQRYILLTQSFNFPLCRSRFTSKVFVSTIVIQLYHWFEHDTQREGSGINSYVL